jgi:hypothetical protein
MNDDKPTRGRPKGATSFTRVQLQELLSHLGPSASVVVGKKWLEEIGFIAGEPAPTIKLIPSEKPLKSNQVSEEEDRYEPIQFSMTSFD